MMKTLQFRLGSAKIPLHLDALAFMAPIFIPIMKEPWVYREPYPNVRARRDAGIPVVPIELFIEILNFLNPRIRDDSDAILKLRLTSWALRDTVTACMRGKLTFHLGRSMTDFRRRMEYYWLERAPSDWLACFAGIGFHWLILTEKSRYGSPGPSKPRPTPGFQITPVGANSGDGCGYALTCLKDVVRKEAFSDELKLLGRNTVNHNAVEFILATCKFILDFGGRLEIKRVQVFSAAGQCGAWDCRVDTCKGTWGSTPPWCNNDACEMEHVVQNRFLKAVGVILNLPGFDRPLRNVKELDISCGCAHYVPYVVRSYNDEELSATLAELSFDTQPGTGHFQNIETVPDFLQMVEPHDHNRTCEIPSSWSYRWHVSALENIETLRFQSRVEDVKQYMDPSERGTMEGREDCFGLLVKQLPKLKRVVYETGVYARSMEIDDFPEAPLESFSAVGFGHLFDPASTFKNVGETLKTLQISDCNVARIKWRRFSSRILHESDYQTMAKFLDALFPTLPNLENLTIEALEYDWNDYKLITCYFKNVNPGYRSSLAKIPRAPFRRPLITCFEEDMDALLRLREAYMARRLDKGLPVDAWLRFLLDFDEVIFKTIDVPEGLFETSKDYEEPPEE